MPDDGELTIQLDPRTARQLAQRAQEEGVSPEQYAAELVAEGVGLDIDIDEPPPGLLVSEEELRASLAEQMRKIRDGLRALQARERAVERWLHGEVGSIYDTMKGDPSRARSAAQVRAALNAEHKRAPEAE